MKKTVVNLLAIACLIISCKTSNTFVNQKPETNKTSEVVGHIKMGLIGYEIIDTANVSVEEAEMLVRITTNSLENEYVFNSDRLVVLKKQNGKYVRKSFYEKSTNTHYKFVTRDSIEFYSEVNLSQKMEEFNTSDEELEELSKMFKVIPYSRSKKKIFGFKSDEILVMHPPDFTKIYSKIFTTDKIPFITDGIGSLSKYITGIPLKSIVWITGVEITSGAIEYNENRSLEKFLNVDTSKLQKLSEEELELKRNN